MYGDEKLIPSTIKKRVCGYGGGGGGGHGGGAGYGAPRFVSYIAEMRIWVNFPRTEKMVKMWLFLELCCHQTV